MATYKRFIPLPALTGTGVGAAGYALRIAYGVRQVAKRSPAATLAEWVEEDGSLASPAIAPQSS